MNDMFLGYPPANVVNWLKAQKLKDILRFTANGVDSTIQLKKNGNPDLVSLEYYDGTWHDYEIGSTISIPAGKFICMRAKNATNPAFAKAPKIPNGADPNEVDENGQLTYSSLDYYQLVMTGKIAASGSIQYLISKDGSATSVPAYGFCKLFFNCTSLTAAPALPATQLADYCYSTMFSGCTSLTAAPALPATQLASNCYSTMFYNCSSLTVAPQLPATQLASNCYYYMFYNCSSLTVAPQLPATQLADYCYRNMFYNCSKLSSIDISFTTWSPTNATINWVNNVAPTGTFTCPASLLQTRGISNIPENWTIVTK